LGSLIFLKSVFKFFFLKLEKWSLCRLISSIVLWVWVVFCKSESAYSNYDMSFFENICYISEIADCCFIWVSFSLFNTSASNISNFFTYLSFFSICFSSFWSISSFNLFYVSIRLIKYCSCLIFEASFITYSSNLFSYAFLKYCLSILSTCFLFFFDYSLIVWASNCL
jgi:hypothetical protein